MKPGEAKVGQRVRTTTKLDSYPEITVGTWGTVVEIVTQIVDAQDDALLVHPHGWKKGLAFPCNASDLEAVY